MKKTLTIGLLGALALAAQTSPAISTSAPDTNKPAAKLDSLFADETVAKGDNIEIKRSQLDEAFINAKAAAAARGVELTDAERDVLEARLLDELVVSKILTAKATDADKAKAGESADKFIAESRKQLSSEDAFLQRLKMNNLNSVDELQKKLVSEALPNLVLERELKSQITVTDAQIKKFYDDNPDKFEQPQMVRASHILIGTRDADGNQLPAAKKDEKRKQIEDILKRAKGGEDFAKLAKQYSEDPGSKDNGGEYTFPRGQMMPEFEAAAFALKKAGEITDVVTTTYGFHIIKLSEIIPSKTVALAEASAKIKDFLTRQQAGKIIPDYITKLENAANVKILDTKLVAAKKKAEEMAKAAEAAAVTTPATAPVKPAKK